MVGAAITAAPHRRLSFSNYGSRIDCYAWGQNVYLRRRLGGDATNTYTASFGGTSGASPIVAERSAHEAGASAPAGAAIRPGRRDC